MSTLDSRQRDPLHRGVCGRRGEATLERFPQARQLAVAQTTRAAMPSRPERFETALLVVATELPEPLGGEAERFREPSEVALRVFGELNEDRVALELLVLLDERTADLVHRELVASFLEHAIGRRHRSNEFLGRRLGVADRDERSTRRVRKKSVAAIAAKGSALQDAHLRHDDLLRFALPLQSCPRGVGEQATHDVIRTRERP